MIDIFSYKLGQKAGGGGEIALQDKTITENGEYTADAGYDGLGKVTVDVAGSGGIAAGVSYDEFDSSGNLKKATVYGTEVPSYFAYSAPALVSVTLPENLKKINTSAFERAQKLELSSLPNSVTEIKNKAFQACTSLKLTSLPDQLDTLGTSAFGNADIFTNLTIPESVRSIYGYAFGYNNSLQSVTFKGKPSYMQDYIFYDAKNLTTINVPWAEGAVSGAPWGATKATINYNYTGA